MKSGPKEKAERHSLAWFTVLIEASDPLKEEKNGPPSPFMSVRRALICSCPKPLAAPERRKQLRWREKGQGGRRRAPLFLQETSVGAVRHSCTEAEEISLPG